VTAPPPSRRWSARATFFAVVSACAVLAEATDRWCFHHLAVPGIYDHGWARLVRFAGYVPLWLLVGAGFLLSDWHPRRGATLGRAGWRAWLLVGSAAAGGLVAEGLKLLCRRERPNLTDGAHVLRPWADQPFSSAQLGLPSSEVAVAFAAAAILARLLPRAWVLWYGLAWACALTRVVSGAHFASDALVGALVGFGVGTLLWERAAPQREGTGTERAA